MQLAARARRQVGFAVGCSWMLGVGYCSHCAATGAVSADKTITRQRFSYLTSRVTRSRFGLSDSILLLQRFWLLRLSSQADSSEPHFRQCCCFCRSRKRGDDRGAAVGVAALLAAFWMRQAFIAEPTNAAQTPSQQTQPVGTSGSSGAKPGSFDARSDGMPNR